MAKKKRAAKPKRPATFIELTTNSIKCDLEESCKRLAWQLSQGGGYLNIHFLDTLRGTENAYRRYAAHLDAVRSLKIHLGEERVT